MATISKDFRMDTGAASQPGAKRDIGPVYVVASYTFVLVISTLMILAGAGIIGAGARPELLTGGLVGVLLGLTLGPIAYLLLVRRGGEAGDPRVLSKMQEVTAAVRHMADQAVLSDDARRLLNRSTERELLCAAIEEDIQAEDWDAALVLCAELAGRFGYRAEAEGFRARIDQARASVLDRKVADAISQLDGLIVQRRWDAAVREAQRIARLYPESPRVENGAALRERVEQARAVYKQELERRFLEAAQAGQIEDAMDLLKELDLYLTEAEAEPFREVARGVITKARENLGAQFKLAVQDRQWAAASAIGRRIINEFPNTRMATEVRGMLDGILQKANAPVGV